MSHVFLYNSDGDKNNVNDKNESKFGLHSTACVVGMLLAEAAGGFR